LNPQPNPAVAVRLLSLGSGLVDLSLGAEANRRYGVMHEGALEAAETAVHALRRALSASCN